MKNKIAVIISFVILTIFSISGSAGSNGVECDTIYPLMGGFLAQHLTYKKFSKELEDRTVAQFVKMLDPSKLYFYESDVATLKKNMDGVFSQLGSKKCEEKRISLFIVTEENFS